MKRATHTSPDGPWFFPPPFPSRSRTDLFICRYRTTTCSIVQSKLCVKRRSYVFLTGPPILSILNEDFPWHMTLNLRVMLTRESHLRKHAHNDNGVRELHLAFGSSLYKHGPAEGH